MRYCVTLVPYSLLTSAPLHAASNLDTTILPGYRAWFEEVELRERGRFSRIRWFCNDGTVLPPRSNTCAEPVTRVNDQAAKWSPD